MEVTALCIRLVLTVLLLMVQQVHVTSSQKSDEVFPQVVPDRQQRFEYESFTVSCEGLEGLTGWRVVRRIRGDIITCASSWSASTGPCRIKSAFPAADSGEYWCEYGAKKTSTVNITVTAGPVILESPTLPVMEGDAVTLACRKKQASSNHTAQFFKDGHFLETSSTGELTINVSVSKEGLYKCRISDVGESPVSWLTVRAQEEAHSQLLLHLVLLSVGLCALALLLFVGLMRWSNNQRIISETETSPSSFQSTSSPQTMFEEASVAVPSHSEETYAVVTKPRMERGALGSCDG